ncbi:MAG: hypothetical protein ABR551_01270 [Gemmatimonadales bacterium]
MSRGVPGAAGRMGAVVALLAGIASSASAQLGTSSLAPEWAEEQRVYATTAAFWADSLGMAWDGEDTVTLRIRVVEIVQGEPDRYLAGGSLLMEPGSRLVVLEDLMPAALVGRGAEILRWDQGWGMPATIMGPSGWDADVLRAGMREGFTVDWTREALLVVVFTAVEERDLREMRVVPMFLVRPFVMEPEEPPAR